MGKSTHVTAFIDATDETYIKHRNVLLACLAADISLPKETAEYFGEDWPRYELLEEKLETKIFKTFWKIDYAEGYEILIEDLPKGVHKIRFYNSW